MKTKAGYKRTLFLVLAITAVVCCTLPFLASTSQRVGVYISSNSLSKDEEAFVNALSKEGFDVKINPTSKENVNIWLNVTIQETDFSKFSSKYDFVYIKEYAPIEWYKQETLPIVLTPYQDLYEHYTRSNVKTAVLKIDTSNSAKRFKEILNWLKENENH